MSNCNHFLILLLLGVVPERVKCLVEYIFNAGWRFDKIKGATTVQNRLWSVTVRVAVIRDGTGLLLVLPRTVIALFREGFPGCRNESNVQDRSRKGGGRCGKSKYDDSEGFVRVHV